MLDLASLVLLAPVLVQDPRPVLVGIYDSGAHEGTEIVSVQSSTHRAVLCNSAAGTVDVIDLASPREPKRVARQDLGLAKGETLTSVAFHPRDDVYLAAIQASDRAAAGRVELRNAASGKLLATLPTGVGPDSVKIDPTGAVAGLACEGELFTFDAKTKRFESAPGSVTLVRFAAKPEDALAVQVALPSADGVEGFVRASDGRVLEREVDWNGNGKIDSEVDFDGDGSIGDKDVLVGTCEGVDVLAKEKAGETFLIPLVSNTPAMLEPEVVAFSPDGKLAYTTLQENNGLAVIDAQTGKWLAYRGLGATEHAADVKKDGKSALEGSIVALREPDGVAVSADGRFVFTADEGDTGPKLTKLKEGQRAGGGRTLSVFDAASGRLLGDTGSQIDAATIAAGLYQDDRSEAKGSEPEMVVAFEFDGHAWAGVSLERAGGVALVDLADPAHPRVVGVAGGHSDPKIAVKGNPEGIDLFRDARSGEAFLVTANETAGTLSVFQILRERAR